MAGPFLEFRAGRKAYELIRDGGLDSDQVRVIPGAAGGPKWFVLRHLDQAIFGSWLRERANPIFLLGSSIGSWRFAAVTQRDPDQAMAAFQEAYTHQYYTKKPSAEQVSAVGRSVLDRFLSDSGVEEILSHPYLRLNLMAVRCRFPVSGEGTASLSPGLIAAFLANGINRRFLSWFFERALFFDPRDTPPFYDMSGFPLRRIPLSRENLKPALLASGAIPLVMRGVSEIPGAPPGVYRDGGLIDYHLDIPFLKDGPGIVLYPHYAGRIVSGWFDKNWTSRKPSPRHMESVLLLSPSPDFVKRLPFQKIPDRTDFKTFFGRDPERIAYWTTVADQSRILGEAFLDAVASGRIREQVKPLMEGPF